MRGILFWLLVLFAGLPAYCAQRAVPYYDARQNPWQTYSSKYQQYTDVPTLGGLIDAHVLALPSLPGGQAFEQGVIYFPTETNVYLDGRFLAYINGAELDLNRLQGRYQHSITFYLVRSRREVLQDIALAPATVETSRGLAAERNPTSRALSRQGWNAVLASSFIGMLVLLLGTRTRGFYSFFSLQNVLGRAEDDLGGTTVFTVQALVHLLLAALCGATFSFCYLYGQDPILLSQGPGAWQENLAQFSRMLGTALLVVAVLALYVYVIGLALFNINLEEGHVRGNLELFSAGGLLLALLAWCWAFARLITWEQFVGISSLAVIILFCVKGFFLYKILVYDRGLKKLYSLSYICLTEVLPSIFLIRLLTDR